jgi:hypothetical protein
MSPRVCADAAIAPDKNVTNAHRATRPSIADLFDKVRLPREKITMASRPAFGSSAVPVSARRSIVEL